MPKYDYRCEKCGQFEAYQSIKDDALTACPTCGSPVKRLISRNVNILFKGQGFHVTDYRSDSYKSSAKADNSTATSSSSSSSTNGSSSSNNSGSSSGSSGSTSSAAS